jgi:hypothetical protein
LDCKMVAHCLPRSKRFAAFRARQIQLIVVCNTLGVSIFAHLCHQLRSVYSRGYSPFSVAHLRWQRRGSAPFRMSLAVRDCRRRALRVRIVAPHRLNLL